MTRSIFKESTMLREAIKTRMNELKLTQEGLSKMANSYGKKIARQGILKYLQGEKSAYKPGAMTDENIFFVSLMLDIPIYLNIGNPSLSVEVTSMGEMQKLTYIIPKRYDKAEAEKLLKLVFPETIIP